MPDIQIEVICCPHEAFKDEEPLPSWPRLPGVQVRLTKMRGRRDPLSSDTGGDGVAVLRGVDVARYKVETINGPGLWTPAKPSLEVTEAEDCYRIIMVPDGGRQLVRWKLSCDDPAALAGATIEVADHDFASDDDGRVNAVAPVGTATAKFKDVVQPGGKLLPQREKITFPVSKAKNPAPREMEYSPDIQLSVEPVVRPLSGREGPLEGAVVTLELNGNELAAKPLGKGRRLVTFDGLKKGTYGIRVIPPTGGMTLVRMPDAIDLQPGDKAEIKAAFKQQQRISGRIETEDGKPVTQAVQLLISGDGDPVKCQALGGTFETFVAMDGPFTISVAAGQDLAVTGAPLEPAAAEQPIEPPPNDTVVKLQYKHAIHGTAVDEQGKPVPGVMVDIFDAQQAQLTTVAAGPDGQFIYGVATPGDYFVAQHPQDKTVGARSKVAVHSNGLVKLQVLNETGLGGGEAVTDLSAYPVLTEDITTTGPPAPVSGGSGPGGADYGQVVDQAMRDVLGWRPGGDVAGFQAALAGVFQLRDVEGHTEWTWQQRGYAVQADMGALTGAQASIYARARGALDQILPLLTGLTAINPALYPPQDLEAIRTIVIAELNELVSELALEGGPRIERVDELFSLLLGNTIGSSNLNPDLVQGQLGTLRDRFGLVEAYVDTVGEERIVTNFRIVVEQVLALQASWNSIDRKLLSVLDANSSLGTVLIWLSRGLEAVCESVDDLTFALDSVFVDAAQRQVIELVFGGQPPLLLSDLLDWIVRACRDEGPRLIQDSGKDGVSAFAPVLRKLQSLVHQTRALTRPGVALPPGMKPVPDGMRTPRVNRAFQVLLSQLDEAARLASLVQRGGVPQITSTNAPSRVNENSEVVVTLTGVNFRDRATAFLIPANREDIADVPARHVNVPNRSTACAKFRIPGRDLKDAGLRWQVVLMNEDGTTTEPAEIIIKR